MQDGGGAGNSDRNRETPQTSPIIQSGRNTTSAPEPGNAVKRTNDAAPDRSGVIGATTDEIDHIQNSLRGIPCH